MNSLEREALRAIQRSLHGYQTLTREQLLFDVLLIQEIIGELLRMDTQGRAEPQGG